MGHAMVVSDAIAVHMQWKMTFQFHISMQEALPREAVDRIRHETQCLLGAWLHGAETVQIRATPEYLETKRQHSAFHQQMMRVAEAMARGEFAQAKRMIEKGSDFDRVSWSLASAITAMGRL